MLSSGIEVEALVQFKVKSTSLSVCKINIDNISSFIYVKLVRTKKDILYVHN